MPGRYTVAGVKLNTLDIRMNILIRYLCICTVGVLFCSSSTIAQDSDTNTETRFVDIDGFKFNVKLAGLEHLKDSTSVVVLEMGAGSTLKSWNPIFEDLSEFAPVFAYERSGFGKSEWNGIKPTPLNTTTQLRKLLKRLDLPPPYVLAGHSWGGVLIRTYAGHYKIEVKALVYIDPMDYEKTFEEERAVFSDIGVDPDKALNFIEDVFASRTKEQSEPMAVQYNVIDKFTKTDIEKRGLGKEPNLPMAVFIGTKMMPAPRVPPGFEKPFDHKE